VDVSTGAGFESFRALLDRGGAMANKVLKLLGRTLTDISSLCLFVVLILIGCDIFMRFAFTKPIPGTLEVSEQIVVIMTFFCLAYVGIQDRHIRTTIIIDRLPTRGRYIAELLAIVLMIVLLTFLFWRTSVEAWRSFSIGEVRMGLIEIPIYPAKIAIPLGIAVAWSWHFLEFLNLISKGERRKL
jgi:TRAP-type C4-dicarboxylate transport system permease small subunit